ncbi:MAG: YebC/PmpR family DNA-binding transcriptional regulator [Candidatus Sungbacteria bacterium]|nr:YebC/PmpR family DNA-binding transcriptional regulator [Candidatus Sungbacteria bacterium]
MSGHNKWAQIKHKKAITDAKKGTLFSKMVREIAIAAKTGDPNPEMNIRLKAAIERARSIGLPKDNIDRAVAKAAGHGDGSELFEFLYEASAPGGVAILIEGITDNKNRTFNEIKHLLSKHDARLAEPGSLLWNFEKIGIIEVSRTNTLYANQEDFELALIGAGASDIACHEDATIVEVLFSDLAHVRKELKKLGVRIIQSGHDYKSRSPLSLSELPASLETLLDAISEHDDVQEVYTNINNRT